MIDCPSLTWSAIPTMPFAGIQSDDVTHEILPRADSALIRVCRQSDENEHQCPPEIFCQRAFEEFGKDFQSRAIIDFRN